jgi:hypothetical protein
VKKNKDHGNVGVLVGGGHHVQVVVLDESVCAVLGANQRGQRTILFLK